VRQLRWLTALLWFSKINTTLSSMSLALIPGQPMYYNIVAAHGYFGRLIFQYASFNNSRSLRAAREGVYA
jgi:hypothetical protein